MVHDRWLRRWPKNRPFASAVYRRADFVHRIWCTPLVSIPRESRPLLSTSPFEKTLYRVTRIFRFRSFVPDSRTEELLLPGANNKVQLSHSLSLWAKSFVPEKGTNLFFTKEISYGNAVSLSLSLSLSLSFSRELEIVES